MLSRTVFDASQERMEAIFSEFDNIIVSFSGGKDSAVMLHLMIDYMRKNNIRKKIYVYHLDYEGQYSATTDFVTEMLTTNLDIIEPLWCCLPIAAQSAVSMFTDHWKPWEKTKQNI
ncbi:TPA: phosphoadenosine phosphosulfate reductase family protein, partial [Listeria monocytogenes]|nr:phosphoadenosine phosphosulfate reductase family protein [Listeria monocytogenes]